jgi:predicted ArsR family transcriptional regulator
MKFIIERLRRGTVTSAELAEKLEVTRKTIFRDIEFLRDLGFVIYGTHDASNPNLGFEFIKGNCPFCQSEISRVKNFRFGDLAYPYFFRFGPLDGKTPGPKPLYKGR